MINKLLRKLRNWRFDRATKKDLLEFDLSQTDVDDEGFQKRYGDMVWEDSPPTPPRNLNQMYESNCCGAKVTAKSVGGGDNFDVSTRCSECGEWCETVLANF